MALDDETRSRISTLRQVLDLIERHGDIGSPFDSSLSQIVDRMFQVAFRGDPLSDRVWLVQVVRFEASVLAAAKSRRRKKHGYHADGDETCTAELLADRMIAAYPVGGSFPWAGRLSAYRAELVQAIETSSYRGRGKGDGQGAGAAEIAMLALLTKLGMKVGSAHTLQVAKGRQRSKR